MPLLTRDDILFDARPAGAAIGAGWWAALAGVEAIVWVLASRLPERYSMGYLLAIEAIALLIAPFMTMGWDLAAWSPRHGNYRRLFIASVGLTLIASIVLGGGSPIIAAWFNESDRPWAYAWLALVVPLEALRSWAVAAWMHEGAIGARTVARWSLVRWMLMGIGISGLVLSHRHALLDEDVTSQGLRLLLAWALAACVEVVALSVLAPHRGPYRQANPFWQRVRKPVAPPAAKLPLTDETQRLIALRPAAERRHRRALLVDVTARRLAEAAFVALPILAAGRWMDSDAVTLLAAGFALASWPWRWLSAWWRPRWDRAAMPSTPDVGARAGRLLVLLEQSALVAIPALIALAAWGPSMTRQLLGAGWDRAGQWAGILAIASLAAPWAWVAHRWQASRATSPWLALLPHMLAGSAIAWGIARDTVMPALWLGVAVALPLDSLAVAARSASASLAPGPLLWRGGGRLAWLWLALAIGWLLLARALAPVSLSDIALCIAALSCLYLAVIGLVQPDTARTLASLTRP